jgi:ABC-type branched-subunit amino acid transport system permease subunit
MNGYHVDWVGAISAGVVAGFVFFLLKSASPRLKGVSFYWFLVFWLREHHWSCASFSGVLGSKSAAQQVDYAPAVGKSLLARCRSLVKPDRDVVNHAIPM